MSNPLILLIIGVGLIAVPLKLFPKHDKLKKSGLRAEGIIFDLINSRTQDSNHQYPVIRFVTEKNEWITKEYEISLPGKAYRKGQKVNVFYDPANPEDFIIELGYNTLFLCAFIVAGMLVIGIAAWCFHSPYFSNYQRKTTART